VIAPLVARGEAIGVLTLIRTDDAVPFTEDEDLPFFEELAARAALAVENGRLFAARNRVARSLQDALLPPAMPRIAGLELAARYQVADADVEIGGDFYDVIRVGPATWGLVVGDVCGRGPDAAALTGLVRHTLRTAVLTDDGPSVALRQTNEAMISQIDDARFCTAAYLRVDLAEGRTVVAASSAGHPRPALVRADGTVELLECGGTLLGVVPEPELIDLEVELAPGDAIVLYTDGVTEARDGASQFGDGRLVDTLASLAGRSAEAIASGLDEAVLAFRGAAHDDTAILVARAAPRA
jgi:serine phosphatase RsbU (regulator of sigma subunit)